MIGSSKGVFRPGVERAAQTTKSIIIRCFPAVIRTLKTVIRGEYQMTPRGNYFFSTWAPGVTSMLFVVKVVPVAR